MRTLFLSLLVSSAFLRLSLAQDSRPISARDDVSLRLEIVGPLREFHLGELIPIKYSYASRTAGRYLWVNQSVDLDGGRPVEFSCTPPEGGVSDDPRLNDRVGFDQLLVASCGGFVGGFGGSCGDCELEYPLTATALSFGPAALNKYVHFKAGGAYTCKASAADVTAAPRDSNHRPALLLKSNPIVLTIVNDPGWAHSAAMTYSDEYGKICRGDDVTKDRFLQCSEIAGRLTYLDNPDSLREEVKWFDGRDHGWENGFWLAIQKSSQPKAALQLMTTRMQEPDFQVSNETIRWLASAELRIEAPDAFRGDALESYHNLAVEFLRKYARLLGSSLSNKTPIALAESVKTYRSVAEQRYCGETLIQADEVHSVLMHLH